jgi:signal transduction histidine kinase/CheY-like chemotaxis protein
MSGYSRSDLEAGDVTWQRMTPLEWMQVSEQAMKELNARGQTTAYEKQYLRKDNSRWWGLFAAKLLNDDTIVEFVVDTTERNEAEQALKDADRRKDQFLATLAHELRNPLVPISNAMHLLKSKEGRRATDPLIEMAQRQVNHILRLVDDLLEVSRIVTGKIEVRKSPVALATILSNALETSKPLMDSGRHQLHIELPPESLMLDADNVRLTQVFANLLNNAAKYTDVAGEIWLTARREGKQAVVSVRDNGIGIPSAMLPHIFEMFVQGQRSASRSQGGLGIGLTMAHNLVELHGGTIEARSEGPDQGSEFIVRLPLLEQTPGAPKDDAGSAAMPERPLAGLRILVADDNHDAADSLAILLRISGADACVVHDGPAALAALDSFGPHAAVIDIGMPGMTGHEVAERIRRHSRYAGVTLIALTGWGQDADRSHSHASGFDRHFTKPTDFAALEAYLFQKRRQ